MVKHREIKHAEQDSNLIVALDKISDPGNLGTIIRTAYWFGVDRVLLSSETADPYNPKVIRSTQGGIFHTNISEDVNLEAELKKLQSDGYSVYLFTLDAKTTLTELSGKLDSLKSAKSVIVFGNEARGISPELLDSDYEKILIERFSDCESLNAAIACSIAMYELRKNI